MTDADKKAKKEAKREASKLAKAKLAELIASIVTSGAGKKITDEMVELAIALKKAPRSASVTGVKSVVATMFESGVGTTVSEDDIWVNNRLGRAEMRKASVDLIKKSAPESRLWISFNPETGVYALEAIGENAPDGWTGYTPVKVDEIEIM